MKNACTRHPSATPFSDLKQHLTDAWATKSQNIIDEAMDQWDSGYLHVKKQKDITLNIC